MEKYLCLTCKYEPDWSEPSGGEYSRRSGECKYKVKWPKRPSWVYAIKEMPLIRYSDNSGLPSACATWEPKK